MPLVLTFIYIVQCYHICVLLVKKSSAERHALLTMYSYCHYALMAHPQYCMNTLV